MGDAVLMKFMRRGSSGPAVGIMVGVLVVACPYCADIGGHRFLGRAFGLDRQVLEQRKLSFDAELDLRRKLRRIVERTGRQVDMLALEIVVEQRRPARSAKAARRFVRTVEGCGSPARPADRIARHTDQRDKEIARRLLAHAAMADMRGVEHRGHMIAHRAALAATRGFRLNAFGAAHDASLPLNCFRFSKRLK